VSAHSEKHDTREKSTTLSTQRARHVVDYLTKNGIDERRLTYQGFGHDIVTNLKTTETPLAEKVLSSTVEFKVIRYTD
jgi:outer membrane protein OmpA-like peptidoglycan-associated protein